MDFAIPADHRVKVKEREKRDKYLDLARELKKKTMEQEDVGDTSCNWCSRNNLKRIGKGTGKLGNKRTSRDHPITALLRSTRISRRVLET